MSVPPASWRAAAVAALLLAGCNNSRPVQYPQQPPPGYAQGQYPPGQYAQYPQQYPQGQYPQGQYPQGQYPPGQYPQGQYPAQRPPGYAQPGQYPQQPYPAQPPPGPAPTTAPAAPQAPVAYDPINANNVQWERARAKQILGELVAALPAAQQQRVQNVPLVVDSAPGEVNAFAACTQDGKALMTITDGLLDIEAHLANAKSTDEMFHTNKTQQYIQLIAKYQQPKKPIVQPPAGFFNPTQQVNPTRVARQHVLFDEQVAFVLGHELAHHYLGHLSCTGRGGLDPQEIGRVLSSAVPLFNQPNEFAADAAGTNNMLTAGARQGTHWTDEGAILTMQFFEGVEQLSPLDILFGFDRSHPAPQLRIPVIQQTANAWRATGGRGLPILPTF